MRKKREENFIEKVPVKNPEINWKTDEEGKVTLEVENKGVFNRIFQVLLKKPKVSFIHLDEMGSFVWPEIDGERNLIQIGMLVEEHFGDKAKPVYERLSQYFQILESYGFIKWNN